ncbi:MAG: hypothetical protein Q8O76_06255 [Chloroflexota bacterium]|nr:hypothetical protein [Chloroflexota bacterium]
MAKSRLSPKTRMAYVNKAKPILIAIAKQRTVITYDDLMSKLGGPGRGYIGEVLGTIVDAEIKAGRPKLSAVVVHTYGGLVGGGFFGFPNTPANVRRSTPEEQQRSALTPAEKAYWRSELAKLYEYWGNQP